MWAKVLLKEILAIKNTSPDNMQKSTDREGDSEVEKRLGTMHVAYGRGKPGELLVVNTPEKTPYSSCKKPTLLLNPRVCGSEM